MVRVGLFEGREEGLFGLFEKLLLLLIWCEFKVTEALSFCRAIYS